MKYVGTSTFVLRPSLMLLQKLHRILLDFIDTDVFKYSAAKAEEIKFISRCILS